MLAQCDRSLPHGRRRRFGGVQKAAAEPGGRSGAGRYSLRRARAGEGQHIRFSYAARRRRLKKAWRAWPIWCARAGDDLETQCHRRRGDRARRKFLLIEEESEGERVFNQPAGHWEPANPLAPAFARRWKSPPAASCRATWSACTAGVTRHRTPLSALSSARTTFRARPRARCRHHPRRVVSAEELRSCRDRLRSPLVLRLRRGLPGRQRFPLDLVAHVA